MIRRILFVCTGNIFRSLSADVALTRLLAGREDVHVSSAGTVDHPHVVWSYVREYLLSKGFDVRGHARRTLTRAIMDESDLVVAMSTDHQATIRVRYGREVPLYLEVCGEAAEWLPDIEDVIPDYQTSRLAVEAHVRSTIDRIVELAPRMADNIDVLMNTYGTHRNQEGWKMNYPFQSDDAGKLIVRLTVGGLILLHGVSKILNPGSLGGMSGQLAAMGMPAFFAYGVYIGEVLAPLMVILGIFSRIGGLLVVVNMIVAILLVHTADLFTLGKSGGWALELQGFYLFCGLAIYFLGSGKFAVKPD